MAIASLNFQPYMKAMLLKPGGLLVFFSGEGVTDRGNSGNGIFFEEICSICQIIQADATKRRFLKGSKSVTPRNSPRNSKRIIYTSDRQYIRSLVMQYIRSQLFMSFEKLFGFLTGIIKCRSLKSQKFDIGY